MNLDYADILVDGLFARRVIKIIKNEEFNHESEKLLNMVLTHLNNSIIGKQASLKYTTDENTLQTLHAYGQSISIVQSLAVSDETDCVEKYVNEMIAEIKLTLDNKKILISNLGKTLDYYNNLRDISIAQGSRFNMNIRSDDPWQRVSRY